MPTAVPSLQNVSCDPYGGEAHALVGENGAGRSTIVKMLAGQRPDSGTLEIDGTPVELNTPADAKAAGIAMSRQAGQLSARRMVGRDLGALFPKQDDEPRAVALTVDRTEFTAADIDKDNF